MINRCMKLEKLKYIKLARDVTCPLYNEQCKIDALHERMWFINSLYNHRRDGPPAKSYISEIIKLNSEISDIRKVIDIKLADTALWEQVV